MANQEHLDLLKQGVEVWNQWRKEHPDVVPDLSFADLSFADLSFADLSFADLSDANLYHANLQEADLSSANLSSANLGFADLRSATLIDADLSLAHLNGANLSLAHLILASLQEADLSSAKLSSANLGFADLRSATLFLADLSGADLSGADLSKAMLVGTNFTKAILADCNIYGIAVWNVELEGAIQNNLVITHEYEPTITVDNLEVAQFIYLLLNHKKLRDVLNAVAERGVLILGRFGGGGLEILQAIAAKLREESYLPIIFDFERPQDHDYTETVKTLVGLARFVIVDLSGPSVPQELSHTVPFFDIPFVPIIEQGRNVYSMFVDLFKYPWVLRPPIEFATVEELLVRMPSEVIVPAEKRHQARQKLLDGLFKKA